ncbi:MAG: DoxX family membrane protein [Bacteroidetes bacterium]|nr:DoxX family membrane protein [Bacteroidota bacterium]
MKQLTTTAARIMFAVPFLVFGIMHFMQGSQMAGYVPSFIPGGVFWVYLVGLALIAAAVSIIIQKKAKIACLLLAILLMIFVLTIHIPGLINDNPSAMGMMLKDFALSGAALFFSGSFSD